MEFKTKKLLKHAHAISVIHCKHTPLKCQTESAYIKFVTDLLPFLLRVRLIAGMSIK